MSTTVDTIIAPATPVGDSGLAVVRISGEGSLSFLATFFRARRPISSFETHRLYLGRLVDLDDTVIDEVMVVYMAPPHTYTCESVVEVHCHGSRQIVTKILELARFANIRLARPGEFTYRAFINGRIDLVQAEAVSRLIHSSTDLSRRSALQQLDGRLSRELHSFSAAVKETLVMVEAWIDFPEEELPAESIAQVSSAITTVCHQMTELANTYQKGQYVHGGATVALAGLPNAGKSSLMNALLQRDRSIVSPVPGTTRDTIEQSFHLEGIEIRLVDTAGLRESVDHVEQEGVRRARAALSHADLVLLVLDGSTPPCSEFVEMVTSYCDNPSILVVNKSDIFSTLPAHEYYSGPVVLTSAKRGDGIPELRKKIISILLSDHNPNAEPSYVTEQRHFESLTTASRHLHHFLANIGRVELDLLSIDLRDCLQSLAAITGEVTTESVLDEIFSSFCIGK